ncbi:hypothetical protein ACOSP7_026984 [Xanthoceras sorbifolium]
MSDRATVSNLDYPLSKTASHNSTDDMCGVIAKNGENVSLSSVHGTLHDPTPLLQEDVPCVDVMPDRGQLNTATFDNTQKVSSGLAKTHAIGPSKTIQLSDEGLGLTSESLIVIDLDQHKTQGGKSIRSSWKRLKCRSLEKQNNSFIGEVGLGKQGNLSWIVLAAAVGFCVCCGLLMWLLIYCLFLNFTLMSKLYLIGIEFCSSLVFMAILNRNSGLTPIHCSIVFMSKSIDDADRNSVGDYPSLISTSKSVINGNKQGRSSSSQVQRYQDMDEGFYHLNRTSM